MFVLSKRNLIIPGQSGAQPVILRRDVMADVPDWATKTAYFQALVADGKIVPSGKSDRETQKSAEKPVIDHTRDEKPRRASKH